MATSDMTNPYEQIWKSRDLRALNTPVELDNKRPEWQRGLNAFGKEMQATGYGLVALGSQGVENVIGENEITNDITDWGLKGYDKAINESQSGLNTPSVAKVEDIKTASDAVDWAGYQLGKGLPMLGSLALSGGVGGAVARVGANQGIKALAKSAVGDIVKKGVTTKAVQATEGQVVTQAMKQAAAKSLQDTFTRGAAVGGFAGSFGLEGGLAFGEQVAEGASPADSVKSAIAVGGINGALEFLPFYHAAKSIGMGSYAKKKISDIIANDAGLSKKAVALATAKEIGGRVAKGGAVGFGAEGVTEGLQELVSIAGLRWAKDEPLFDELTPDDWSRIYNSAAAGALVGGVAAGAGATISGPNTQSNPKAPVQPTATPTSQTKTQVLEAMRIKLDAGIKEAIAAGDTVKANELQSIKELYDKALQREAASSQTPPAPGVPPVVDTSTVTAQPTREQPTVTEPTVTQPTTEQPIITQETPPVVDTRSGIQTVTPASEAAVPVRETPLDTPTPAQNEASRIRDIISGRTTEQPVAPNESSAPVVDPNIPATEVNTPVEENARVIIRDNLLNNIPQRLTEPETIAAVRSDPNYNLEDQPDGSVRIVGVVDPDTNNWVGVQPTTQQASPTAPASEKTGVLSDDVTKQLLQAIRSEEEMFAKLAQGEALPQEPVLSTSQSKAVDPWTAYELEFDIKSTPNMDIAGKWGQEIADIVKNTNENDKTDAWWADLATKAKPQQDGALATLIKAGEAIPEDLGGVTAEELVKTGGFAPNTVEKLVKMSPEGWKLKSITKGGNLSIPQWENEKGDEQIGLSGNKFVWWNESGDAEIIDTYEGVVDFLNTKKAPPASSNSNTPSNPPKIQAIADAIANGLNEAELQKIEYIFDLNTSNSKWEASFNTIEGLVIKSKQDSPEGPQWEILYDDQNDSLKFTQVINGKFITTEISQMMNVTKSDIEVLEIVNKWVVAELIADIKFGKTSAELSDKWGVTVASAAFEYKYDNININGLIDALANNPSAGFDIITGEVTSPSTGELQGFAKEGIYPQELGGTTAKQLIELDGFSPNTVEEWVKLAPPGWTLNGAQNDNNSIYPYYGKLNSSDVITIEENKYKINHVGSIVETYHTYDELLKALNLPNNNWKPLKFGEILLLKDLILNNGFTDSVLNSVKKMLPPEWVIIGFDKSPNSNKFIISLDNGDKFITVTESEYIIEDQNGNTLGTYNNYGDFIDALITKNKPQDKNTALPSELDVAKLKDKVVQFGFTPDLTEQFKELAPPGFKLDGTVVSGSVFIVYYTNPATGQNFQIGSGGYHYYDNSMNIATLYDTYEEVLNAINGSTPPQNNSGVPDSNHSSSSTSPSTAPPVLPGAWSPAEMPNGYKAGTHGNNIKTPEGTTISLSFSATPEALSDIAHIHNYLKNAPIPFSEKIKLFKEFPTSSAGLTAFKANHPYLIRKVSIDEATSIEQAKDLLNDILIRRDKYSFDEILGEAIKFQQKYGDEEFIAALANAPKENTIGATISPAPHLDGWLQNMRSEEELLSENPFEGVWADYEVNKGSSNSNVEASRYGVIIINPKTGKVLLRKVSNQYEGITWDFARGGADRFGDPNAKPNLIDTNAVSDYPVNNPSKRYMEHPMIAAKREAKEEFGLDVKIVGQLAKGFFTKNIGYEQNMASLYYVGVPVGEQTDEHLLPSHGSHIKETDETRWVDLHEARRLVMTEPTLGSDPVMKRDGNHMPRLARISRTLEAVFNPDMQKSDLDYRSSTKGMKKYFKNGMSTEFPNILTPTAFNKDFNDLTELQKMQVSAALYVSKRFPNADNATKLSLQKELFIKRRAALLSWMQGRIGSKSVSDILEGNVKLDKLQDKLAKTGGKVVLSLWHGTKQTREALLDDVINPVYFGTGWGGHDTKEGLYLADTQSKANAWGNKSQVNMLIAFNKLKVIPGLTQYDASTFTNMIQTAKNEGYDGILFDDVDDSVSGRQVVAWNMENIIAGGGQSVGFTGKNLYQSKGELKERMDTDTAKVLLDETFGPLAQKMLDSGLLEIVESGGPDGVAGQYFGEEQKIKIYLDYISSPRELIGAVLHEGAHAGMREILGKSAEMYYKDLLNLNKPIAKNALYKTAWEGAQRFGIENNLTPDNVNEINRVRNELKKIDPNFLIEEDLANFVQQADKSSTLWRRIVNSIKVWWAKSSIGKALKERGIGFELTEEMAVGLVTAAMRTQALRRGNDYSTYVGHVSKADWTVEKNYPFGRPSLKYVLSSGGEGFIKYGWGFYTLESLPTHEYYKSNIGNKTYGMHLPDDIPPRIIEWDRKLTQQSSIVKDAITSSANNYLLLRLAVKSKDKYTVHSDGTISEVGVGGSLYNALRDYFIETKYHGDHDGTMYDSETDKIQKTKNIARRDASRKLAEYGLSGVRLLDAGSRFVTITKLANGTYKLTQGKDATTKTKIFSEKDFEKHVGPDLAAAAKIQPVGQSKKHTGFGFYNWVFWRQTDLDRFTVVYKNGNQVANKPNKNVSYDPNGIGIPYAEHPGFADYIINPNTGEKNPAYYSKSDTTFEVDPEELRSNIDAVMGKDWLKQAEEAGLVEIVEGIGPNGESGAWSDGKLRLYAGSMPVGGSPAGVLLHEGKHATFKEVLGNTLKSYLDDLNTLADNGNQSARNAIIHATIAAADLLGIKHDLYNGGSKEDIYTVRAAIEELQPGLLAEEDLAYFVQYGTETQSGAGFLKRLVNQIKAWFAQTKLGKALKEAGLGFELTEGMAVEWAKMGLHKSLAKLRKSEQVKAQALYKAAYMPPSTRLGNVLNTATDTYYSMGIQEIKDTLWTDPTDSRQEYVNKPGLLQKLRANFVDFFAEIEKKSTRVYDAYSLMRNKKSARLVQARQEYMLPLRDLIANGPWTAKEVGDMLAARHIKADNVNINLAERASDSYAKRLTASLSKGKQKELIEARRNVRKGKMPDGTDYIDVNGNPAKMSAKTKRKFMFDLVNKYMQFEMRNPDGKQELNEEWELFKDAAGGFSNGGVAKNIVRTVDDVLKDVSKDQERFDKITNLFDAMNRHSLDILEDGGLITMEEHARLLTDKSAYAPLRRESYNVDREIEQLFQRAGQGGSKQIGTRTGTAALSEPTLVLQNALAALEASAAAAERNLANKELYEVIVKDRKAWKPWFSIVDTDKYTTHDKDGFLQDKHTTALNKADITLINKGKKLVIRPNMHNERAIGFVRAVNNLDAQILNGPMSVLNWFNGIVRWVNVTASPVFLMMNAIRDPFTAAYNMQASEAAPYTKEIFENYGRTFKALKKVFMDGNRDPLDADVQMVERWENAGGRISFIDALKESDNTWRSFDAQVARRQGNLKQIMAAKDKWIDGLENFNILFENVMRLSTFDTLVNKGVVSETRAARISQDLTTNFTRRGYKTQALGVWWLFFNATVQGNYQVLRNMMSSKKLQMLAGGTIAFALMLDLFGRAVADDWDEIPDWDKERFIILPIKVGGDFVKIPAPWVYNVLWRMGGMLGETISKKRTAQSMLLDLAAMSTTTLSPVSAGSLPQLISPTAFDPFMQIIENKDFAGNPLGPEGFPGAGKKANSELLWSSTPKGYQSIARTVNELTGGSGVESGAVDLRPADYQVLVKFLTGSLGRFMSDATFGLKESIDKGIEGPKDIPIVKELFSDPYNPLRSQTYHTNIAAIYGAHKLENMYKEGSDRDLVKLHEVRTERNKDLRLYNRANDVERQIKSLRVRIHAAQNRKDDARVKELRGRIEEIQERFNSAYKRYMN